MLGAHEEKAPGTESLFFLNLSIPIDLKRVYFLNGPLLDLRVTCQMGLKPF